MVPRFKFFSILLFYLIIFLFPSCQGNQEKSIADKDPPENISFSTEELKRRTFHFFWDLAYENNLQIPDRHPTLRFSSIAGTGFGFTAYLIGAENGYISRTEAAGRTLETLRILSALPQGPDSSGVSGYKGFFYHFLTIDQALRYKNVELSSIDTGLLMAGILSAIQYFNKKNPEEQEIRLLGDALFRRVEWDWMYVNDGKLSMGWRPERGYIPSSWDGYNEAMILLIMALGSPTHPIADDAWKGWTSTYEWGTFQGRDYLQFSPLFGHQYSHMYIDFRGIQDDYMREKGIDYFENARRATLANRDYCLENPNKFRGYGANQWGLTACDGPAGMDTVWNGNPLRFMTYSARGASALRVRDDGTIAPTAAGGSVPYAPDECLAALKYMWENNYENLIGEYGFKDAFNLSFTFTEDTKTDGWFDHDYLGIDQGPILIQLENHETEFVWNLMKKNPYIIEGLKKAGFKGGWLEEL
ncbi:MAG: Tat pathway signal protein [Saprospiraceae bacterium]|nr:Tat pathway signal protein [Saprospiraceae bacterium]